MHHLISETFDDIVIHEGQDAPVPIVGNKPQNDEDIGISDIGD